MSYSVKDRFHKIGKGFIPQLTINGKIVTITDVELSDTTNFCALVFDRSIECVAAKAKIILNKNGVDAKIEELSEENSIALISKSTNPLKVAEILNLDRSSFEVLERLDQTRLFEPKTTWAKAESGSAGEQSKLNQMNR